MRKTSKKAAEEKAEREKLSPGERTRREIYDWTQSLMAALIFLYEGNKMLVSNLFYTPKAGDIVVFRNVDENGTEKALVKRIIATEGQEVNIDFDNGTVFVDGVPLDEPFVAEPIYKSKQDFIGPKTVPEGCVFVLGDNRNSSHDSRSNDIGMVDARLIIGRVYAVVYPIGEIRWVH